MSHEQFIAARNLALIPCIVAALCSLLIVLCREWAKRDLRERICRPISVRWSFLSSTRLRCGFKVVYCDFRGQIHRASCWTRYHYKEVRWVDDRIVGQAEESLA